MIKRSIRKNFLVSIFISLLLTLSFLASLNNHFAIKTVQKEMKEKLNEQVVFLEKNAQYTYNKSRQNLDMKLEMLTDLFQDNGEYHLDFSNEYNLQITNQETNKTELVKLPVLKKGDINLTDSQYVNFISRNNDVTATIFLHSKQGMIRISTSVKKKTKNATGTYIPKNSEVYRTLKNKKQFFGKAFVVDQQYLTLYKPILSEMNNVIGALYVGVKMKDLLADFYELVRESPLGNAGYIYILNDNGKLMVHPTKEGENIGDLSHVKEILEKKKGFISYLQDTIENKKQRKIAAYTTFEPFGITIVASGFYSEFENMLPWLGDFNLIFALLLSILFSMLAYKALNKKIFNPLQMLIEELDAVANYNLENEVDPNLLRREDEIGKLAKIYDKAKQNIAHLIKELQNSNEIIKDEQIKLEAILNAIPDSIFILDRRGVIKQSFSKKGLLLKEEYVQKKLVDFLPLNLAKKVLKMIQNVEKSNTEALFDFELQIKDKKHFFHSSILPFRENQFISLVQDYTEEYSLNFENMKLRMALEQSGNSIIITDAEGNITYVNKAFEIITGYARDEVIGKNPRILKTDYHDAEFYKEMWKLLMQGDVWEGEFKNKRKNGSLYWEKACIAPVKNNFGSLDSFIAIKEDVTRQRLIEEKLKKAKEDAEYANNLKAQFIANVSHEIRTPLNAILGFSSLLEDQLSRHSQSKEYINGIVTSGKNLLQLINDILDLSKIDAGKTKIIPVPCNLKAVIDEVYQMFYLKTNNKEIIFEVDIDNDFPEQILLDEVRMRQVLFNLVGNAVKFTDKGAVKIHLHFFWISKQDNLIQIALSIEDTGIGIPTNNRRKIFNPFEQANKDDQYKGTGLGLAITGRLVSMMNGDIELQSEIGKGSTFTIHIPDIKVVELAEQTIEFMDPSEITFKYAIAVLFSDIEFNKKIIRTFLQDSNLQLIEADSVEEIQSISETIYPNAILVDLQDDKEELIEKIDAVNLEEKNIPYVILTHNSINSNDFSSDVQAVIQKPLSKAKLFNALLDVVPHKINQKNFKTKENELENIDLEWLAMSLNDFLDKNEYDVEMLKRLLNIKDIKKFANQLLGFSDKDETESLFMIAKRIKKEVDSFQFDALKRSLSSLIEISKFIKE